MSDVYVDNKSFIELVVHSKRSIEFRYEMDVCLFKSNSNFSKMDRFEKLLKPNEVCEVQIPKFFGLTSLEYKTFLKSQDFKHTTAYDWRIWLFGLLIVYAGWALLGWLD